ncbi:MAG: hypothetical protein KAI18_00060 [Candidatus Aenigmarchaeota archaeon]|nr:hypothetical protein [Candidatus Aenigmarchaeota archaeon]
MDIFSKLKDTVQGHIPSKAASKSSDISSPSMDAGIDDILKSDPTADLSKSSKVLEASANADYSGGLDLNANTPLNPPNQIVRDTPPMDTGLPPMPPIDPLTSNPVTSDISGIDSTINSNINPNPTQNAYPSEQTAMAQAAYPSSQAPAQGVAPSFGLDNSISQPSQPMSQPGAPMPPQPQSSPIQSPAAMAGVPEYPQPPKPVSEIQQQDMSGMRKLDISLELRSLKDQINLIIEKLNVIEERTRRFSY